MGTLWGGNIKILKVCRRFSPIKLDFKNYLKKTDLKFDSFSKRDFFSFLIRFTMAEKYAKQKDTLFDTFSLIEKKKSFAAIGPIFPAKKPSPLRLPGGHVKSMNFTNMCARRANTCFTSQ